MPDLMILIGIPGSGKSSWAKENCEDYSIVCPDQIRKEICNDISDQSKNDQVWHIAKERIVQLLESGKNAIFRCYQC